MAARSPNPADVVQGGCPCGFRSRSNCEYTKASGICEVVHRCPPGDSALTPCCGKSPFELPRTDRLTVHDEQVTCRSGSSEEGSPSE